ncbi:5,6-dimethylbenzimidazole synthase [Mesorhizobium sp. M7A.F.Ca.CA.001.07.2.1]|nr:5,6-dimethylbenzimidazole synthase [Mesorhizobium sp. M7A.F.Ce.TU.012.03.2.1]RUX81043.1 5,6-dimethylbenzimidazole synthase [Mesorhizobium sp. M7A.F.Ca.CA.004.08.2.1]RUX88817.1 5,6-dimethylbenzimidazole synthase [Mesorhizobium sp. M7A.F.Ca.CA.004.08.1.1]RUY06410.1 5,6-dimethylbenzimidazole synthase [Mesorhizobium sp. M7A.F.Ca.CA.004.04.1.1]RUY31267.1 5,6-dimethylbenzimidazole synthase [Mesorhizobium sp. M7A.F.Ca.CA.004.12.1.1]RUY56055.1 5,6-dimethylbenzimidazole synthase [Mesorhizobium sp. M
MPEHLTAAVGDGFDQSARDAVYRAMFTRRDVRSHFLPTAIDDDVLARLLLAAHHAPSVGFMQPWNFIVIRDIERRAEVRDLFLAAREQELPAIDEERQELYRKLKLEGICESALNICITCDRQRSKGSPLGRWHNPEMDLYSTVCAVQNFWLAARAEGVGVGWVSIIEAQALKRLLAIPDHVTPIAYLCVGRVSEFAPKPDLETHGWGRRLPLPELIMSETFSGQGETQLKSTVARLNTVSASPDITRPADQGVAPAVAQREPPKEASALSLSSLNFDDASASRASQAGSGTWPAMVLK